MSPEKWIYWNTTDRVFYGVACSALAIWAVAVFIEACRTRPKVKMIVLGVSKGGNNGEKGKVEVIEESPAPSSAAE
jgi:hypothetical protein